MTGESVCVLALFGGNRGNGSKCGLSYWNVNNPATNVNTNIVASQSYQIMEHLTKSSRMKIWQSSHSEESRSNCSQE